MDRDTGQVVYTPERIGVADLPSPAGFSNDHPDESRMRVIEGSSYRDCSTIALMPTRRKPGQEALHPKVADAYRCLLVPMNQKFTAIRLAGMEVADAYNQGIAEVLRHPQLSTWKFILTYECDNTPPPDGLVKLIQTMYSGPWAAVGGLYWVKGESGMPMIYGNPLDPEINFRPVVPEPETVQECRGVAMGFTLWDIGLFRDKRLGEPGPATPWFKTLHDYQQGQGVSAATQDLEFCGRAGALGYRFAVDTRVRVGHVQFDESPTHPAGFVW